MGIRSPIGKPAERREEHPANRDCRTALQHAESTFWTRPGAAGAPGRRQQGPAKQAHARLNKIRQALPACAAGVSVLLTSHAGAAYGVRVWTRIFLPSASRIWTSHCVSVGPGSTPLVGMVQWDQCMHGERVKPARDSQALWDHHLRGGKASRPVLGKFAEPQVCVGGAQMG